jgi:glycine C-acetyltransferase
MLRKKVLENNYYLKNKLKDLGYKCIGNPSPILPVFVGGELQCKLVSRAMMDEGRLIFFHFEGIHVNGIEFPVVSLG